MPSPSLAILRVQSDERLAALARAGHERAFEAIVERYRRPLLRHARRLVGETRSEDVVQQALVSAWVALERGDDVRELGAWLHRIVHNTGLNALRGQRESSELEDSLAGGAAPQEVLERRLTVRETLAALAALPERQREALLRTALEGRSQAEVAESLGLSDGAVRQLVHRARTAVRAAATALTPLPVASWLASLGARSEPVAGRVAELVAGAGAGATLAKAGAIAVIAGGAATGPALVERYESRERAKPERAEQRAAKRDRAAPVPPAPHAPVPVGGAGARGGGGGGRDSSGSGSSGSGSSGKSGSGSSGSGGSGSSGSESSGSSSSGSDSSGSGSSGSSGSGSDSSGSGSSGSSDSGADSSGSGASGSGSSGSGSSGSGSSDSSGSGSSGSGSSGSGSETLLYGTTTSGSGSGSSGSGSANDSSGSGSSGSG